ncbi:hypothetical protein A1OO_10245 [Enterovibrio norvegicus FF-33]|nr:hypothetical protein A1OO_10245 [Enterovibrio norvegicus FF-33]
MRRATCVETIETIDYADRILKLGKGCCKVQPFSRFNDNDTHQFYGYCDSLLSLFHLSERAQFQKNR